MTNDFWQFFNAQDFSKATENFDALNQTEKEEILKQLFYKARNAEMPAIISFLQRNLHEGKTFEDFHKAWFPPKELTHPEKIGDMTYHHFFPVQTRVINAINMENPNEVISIGLTWGTEEELKDLYERVKSKKGNQIRSDSIAKVADKVDLKICFVKSDDNLGK